MSSATPWTAIVDDDVGVEGISTLTRSARGACQPSTSACSHGLGQSRHPAANIHHSLPPDGTSGDQIIRIGLNMTLRFQMPSLRTADCLEARQSGFVAAFSFDLKPSDPAFDPPVGFSDRQPVTTLIASGRWLFATAALYQRERLTSTLMISNVRRPLRDK
jgi:hypothetical protein